MLKNILFIVIFLLANNLFAQTAIVPSGSGTSSDPYQIATLNNLYWITQNPAQWGKVYKQTADIDASSSNTWDSGEGFTPIGNSTTNFKGTYDGNGHMITDLFIFRSNSDNMGLFGFIHAASIVNIGLINVNITGGTNSGGIAGSAYSCGIYQNYSTGSVTSSYNAGGIVGLTSSGTISNCYSTASIISNSMAGGIVGNHQYATVNNCYSTGSVRGLSSTGGIIGYSLGGTTTNSYWDTETSGNSSSAGGTGKTTAQMKTQSTFSGWDFTSTWAISSGSNNGYPTLSIFIPSKTISGNTGVAGVVLSYTDGSAKTNSADANGNYSFTVSSGWSGTVTPSKTGYTFSPTNKTYSNVTANQIFQNYIATLVTFTISGKAGVASAVLTYTDGTAKTDTADASGNYSFTVSYNWSGAVTPSETGYTFSPTNKTYTNVTANQTSQTYTATSLTGIENLTLQIPTEYKLLQNYPNPFNPSTVIRYGLPKEGNVRITIYTILGQEVQILFDGFKKAGYYEVTFDAGRLASGMYIYRIESGSFNETKKMLMMK